MPRKTNYTVVGRSKGNDPYSNLIKEWVKDCLHDDGITSKFVLNRTEDFNGLKVASMKLKLYNWGREHDYFVRVEDGNATNLDGFPELVSQAHDCLVITVVKMTKEEAKQARAERMKKAAEKEAAAAAAASA